MCAVSMFARVTYRGAIATAQRTSVNTCRPAGLIPNAAGPLASKFIPCRTFYGHITDAKMAPNLEPYFKQYAG